ncbi:MAG: ABC-F family ATP-binding cassette domain-containing protein [Syntrophobacteraceae bacterium]
MLTVSGVSKYLGKKELLRNVSFHVHPGERIGLIGPNGSGKSTMFQIVLGQMEPDAGAVSRTRNLRIGYLPQETIPVHGKSILARATDIHEEAGALRNELESLQRELDAGGEPRELTNLAEKQARVMERLEHLVGYDFEARAAKILEGLGFKASRFDRPVSELSGGWVMRLELGRLLLSEPDLLLLDEPTNHLDLESLLWLEDYLLNSSSAFILVSHDRAFLNRVVSRVVEIEQGDLHEFAGNYDFYLEEKAKRQEVHLATYKNQQDRIRQIERFVEKNRYDKKTAGQAQSRLKMLEKIDRIEAPVVESEINFVFPAPARSGRRVIELCNIAKSYGANPVYSGIDLVIERGDKIAFLGPNGAGKSTLLKILAGTVQPDSGERVTGYHTSVGYYAQHQWEQLRPESTVLAEAMSVSGDMLQTQLRGLLGAFLFQGDDVLKKTTVLSGGEKARLVLCKLLIQRPNFLLLDEPTNHLDISSRVVLEKALGDFPGTICFISHDRRFINAVSNKVLVVGEGAIHVFPGNFEDFQGIWKQRLDAEISNGKAAGGSGESGAGAKPRMTQKRIEAEFRNELFRARKPVQDRIEDLEGRLDACHAEFDQLKERLADPDTYKDGKFAQEVQSRYREVRAAISELTAEWEESALELERIEEDFRREKEKQDLAV